MSDMSGPEQSTTPEPLGPEAQGQLKVLTAFVDRLANITTMPEVMSLHKNTSAAWIRIKRGETLPEIEEVPGLRAVDLKYTDYTTLSGPPVTTKPQTSTSERK